MMQKIVGAFLSILIAVGPASGLITPVIPALAVSGKWEKIWKSTDQNTLRLLRMAGLVQLSDFDAFTAEEKEILLKAFDENGRLTPFGARLLQELISARLADPNKYPAPPKRKPALAVKAQEFLVNPALGAEASKAASDAVFGHAPGNSLVTPYDWNRFSPSDSRYAVPLMLSSEEGSPRAPVSGVPAVRILVTPVRPVILDRYNLHHENQYEAYSEAALEEIGIDPELLRRHGARLVHTLSVFNLISIEASSSEAAALAQALHAQGHFARPASQLSPAWIPPRPMPAAQALPSMTASGAALLGGQKAVGVLLRSQDLRPGQNSFSAMTAETKPMIKPNKFYENGYHGEGAVALIVDSGLDAEHPDFADREIIRQDFTDDKDNKDYVGHGTHVGSIEAGTGKASGSQFQGVAYGTRKVIAAKVFGKRPTTTEDTILAGLNWGVQQAQGNKVVVNLSLGGRGDPNDVLSRAVNQLSHMGHAVVVAAGNSGPRDGSVSSPGLARDALTVASVDKQGRIVRYSARGSEDGYKTPAREGVVYGKPDVTMPGGDVDWSMINDQLSGKMDGKNSPEVKCIYSPGIIASKSSSMRAGPCDVMVDGKPLYTKMSGTSMAAPHASGAALLVYDYVANHGGVKDSTALEFYAASRESSVPLKDASGNAYRKQDQGAGLMQLDRLYDLVSSRVKLGLPIGNISATIATWVAERDPEALRQIKKDSSYRVTRFGVVSAVTGNVINSDEELAQLDKELAKERAGKGVLRKAWDWMDRKFNDWFGWDLRKGGDKDLLAGEPVSDGPAVPSSSRRASGTSGSRNSVCGAASRGLVKGAVHRS